jgi:hypothetical protein
MKIMIVILALMCQGCLYFASGLVQGYSQGRSDNYPRPRNQAYVQPYQAVTTDSSGVTTWHYIQPYPNHSITTWGMEPIGD